MWTFFVILGGNMNDLAGIDGIDMWDSLINDLPSPRHELLHNIDDEIPYAALRYGDYKLVQGNITTKVINRMLG